MTLSKGIEIAADKQRGDVRSVWKFTLAMEDEQKIQMPKGAVILSAQWQYGNLCVWALVDARAEKHTRIFRVAGTGHPIEMNHNWTFIDTVLIHDGQLVFHVFVHEGSEFW